MSSPGSLCFDFRPFVSAERVLFFPADTSKKTALEQLAQATASCPRIKDPAGFMAAIFEREEISSTGIGDGLAVPHAKLGTVDDFTISIGISRTGIAWGARDHKDVQIMVMIAASDRQRENYLRVLATFAGLLKNPVVRQALQQADNPSQVMAILL